MAKRKRHDWRKIRKAYEAGMTQPEILLEFECPKSTLCEKVRDEKWVQNELAKAYTGVKVLMNEQKSELIEQDNELFTFADQKANEMSRRRGLIFDPVEKLLKRTSEALDKNETVEKVNIGDGVQKFERRELNSSDLKNLGETIDKASVTLNINPRHASQQINLNTQNNMVQNNEVKTLDDFYDET